VQELRIVSAIDAVQLLQTAITVTIILGFLVTTLAHNVEQVNTYPALCDAVIRHYKFGSQRETAHCCTPFYTLKTPKVDNDTVPNINAYMGSLDSLCIKLS